MTRWDAFETTARCLRAMLIDDGSLPALDATPWELLVEVSSFHLVTPTLGWCLQSAPGIPQEFRDYFEAIRTLNGQRNERLLASLTRIVDILNRAGIIPIPLKGAAYLVDNYYPEPGARFLGDLDLLIPDGRIDAAAAALQAAGFHSRPDSVIPPPSHHHLPVMHDPEIGAGVELHRDVLTEPFAPSVPLDWFCAQTRQVAFGGHMILLPDATRTIAHNIAHSQLFHDQRERIELRHVLDVALVRKRHEADIDWSEIERHFSRLSFGEGLATYLHFGELLFGQPAPRLDHSPRAGAVADLQAQESRNHFHEWAARMKKTQDDLVSNLSAMTMNRDYLLGETTRMRDESDRLLADSALIKTHSDTLRAETMRMQTEIERLLAETSRLRAESERVYGSRSWRLTRPLRAAANFARRWLAL